MINADQLLAHAVGDYILQSDWMANEKTKRSAAALAHCLAYTVPFVVLVGSSGDLGILWRSWKALAVIAATHFVIDRWRLARFVVYAKNFLAPRAWWFPWSKCKGTGYEESRPPWLAVWLLIIADNVMHIAINGAALRWLS